MSSVFPTETNFFPPRIATFKPRAYENQHWRLVAHVTTFQFATVLFIKQVVTPPADHRHHSSPTRCLFHRGASTPPQSSPREVGKGVQCQAGRQSAFEGVNIG
jgi:hypothetical protein